MVAGAPDQRFFFHSQKTVFEHRAQRLSLSVRADITDRALMQRVHVRAEGCRSFRRSALQLRTALLLRAALRPRGGRQDTLSYVNFINGVANIGERRRVHCFRIKSHIFLFLSCSYAVLGLDDLHALRRILEDQAARLEFIPDLIRSGKVLRLSGFLSFVDQGLQLVVDDNFLFKFLL